MATFAMIHGAGDVGWYWHLVADQLRRLGHGVVAPDLPCDDDRAGLGDYADVVIEAIDGRDDVVVVAQSFGGFTAPLVADRVGTRLLVLVSAMIPAPGEKPADWFTNTGWEPTGDDGIDVHDADVVFYHDVPKELADEAKRRERRQSTTPGTAPWPLEAWPSIPTRFVLCDQDRLFPPTFMRRVVIERLGVEPDPIDAGHCVALSRPVELAAMLHRYLTAPGRISRG